MRGSALCRPCRLSLRFLPSEPVSLSGVLVWAPLSYEGPARRLVGALKFQAATRLAHEMAALVVASAPPKMLAGTLVAVPAHSARVRRRGVDQALVLTLAIERRAELASGRCLVRIGPDARQVGRGRAARLSGPAGSITARPPVPRRVLLVDDVVTTGATLAACATALRRAGAEEVEAIAFARTLGR